MRAPARRQVLRINSQRVTIERLRRGWTMAELAMQLGIAASSVSHMEARGAVRVKTVYRLSEVLGIPMDELVCIEHTSAS